MADEQKSTDDGLSVGSICRLIDDQIARTYDAARMQKVWEGILTGPTSPKVFATALVQALSWGRYELCRPQSVTNVNVYVSGTVEPERIGSEIAEAIKSGPKH